ncbi:type I-B CRISPR-associated protein Cas8b1/Cst1 [Thermovenabulum gondwanense]|uniref:CRISPR-associated protein CXXC-CXXC domain-containing protein n=1 Tax=Thermovenabulum gondwanense TaxID=520767 RepID=A0A162MTV1_9FIRM|nr:type I-B CRISPR-associated protein Cas8b1/Cst1 [Thermovenabulum gondwanense]KYO67322.1 hypothetical protein ATZ99_06080 [Thermovenabulum gondwanense]
MERVYLSDWAYNAGIIGFLEIILDGEDIDKQNIIKIGDNYIEFDRSSLSGFSEKFFKKAYERYPRTDEVITSAKKIYEDILNDKLNNETKEELNKLKRRVAGFSKLSKALDNEEIKLSPKYSEDEAIMYLNKIVEILDNNKSEFMENDVKTYLAAISSICGQKSFLQNNVTDKLLERFKEDFEQPIIDESNEYDRNNSCLICGQRKAKRDAMLDTGLVSFLGANKDNKNFFWNFKPKLPICEICELIYFSIFAGLTEFRFGQNKKYYFVDKSESVKELYYSNKLFMELMRKEENLLKEKGILNFLNDYILMKLKEESKFSLANISFIEIDLSASFPKVYGFNISRQKAQFITSNYKILEKLTGCNYKIKDTVNYIFGSFMNSILNNTLNYQYLGMLEQIFINSLKPNPSYSTNLTSYKLQLFNLLSFKYIKIFKRGEQNMDERRLWRMYFFGQELKNLFIERKSQNKISSLAYRLISALRVGDINTFMNLIIRTYMSFEKEVPSLFVSCINNEEDYCALGYSFVNGLLGQDKEDFNNKEEEF